MTNYHIAQINVATMRFARDSAELGPFMEGLERINALAESSPGFVWRLEDGTGNAMSITTSLGQNVLVNISVWESVEALQSFTYKTEHTAFLRRRSEWFESPQESQTALWWVEEGTKPTAVDGIARLQYLRINGATKRAFGFRDTFMPPIRS